MIDKNVIIETLITKSQALPIGHYLDVRTYKRNRYIFIVKITDEEFHLIENGYHQESFVVHISKLKKQLKNLMKKEFPRSNKVRVYTMGEFHEENANSLQRKEL